MSTIELTVPASAEATVDAARKMMTSLISDRLGISREEFLAKLDAGDFRDAEDTDLLHLITLAPFAR